jgi:TRAP transporter TAXI family solute receptor
VTIGTGGVTGVYYPSGGAIAKIVNAKRNVYGIRATVASTAGSVSNVNGIISRDLEFGLVQGDLQYQAYNGAAGSDWAGKPQKDLRAVFSLYPETVTLVAKVDSGIKSLADLKGERVNIGEPGSGQRQNAIEVLRAAGLNWETDIVAESAKAAEAPGLLQNGRIDAFFYTVGHPNGALKEATAGATKVRFVSISGPGIDALVKSQPYFAKAVVPVKAFYDSAENDSDVESFGVKATFMTSAKVPDEIVYAITKEVFANLEDFKQLYPAFYGLAKKNMLEGLSAPIHPGALRYYKEAGLIK